VAALNRLKEKCGCVVYNLGTGKGASVLDMINAFSKASGKEIKYEVAPRRDGDIAACYAGALRAAEKEGGRVGDTLSPPLLFNFFYFCF
jgi:UDP-glucose 4-epimerase